MREANSNNALARKLNTFVDLSKHELGILVDLQSETRNVTRGQELTEEGEAGNKMFVVQAGWACSYKITAGGGRQIIGFPIPGDCVGLRSALLPTSDHSFCALTDAVVSTVETPQMLEIFNKSPRLGAAFLWAVSRDEAMIVEHLVSLGRRSALERTAHFFMELSERLTLVGLASETQFDLPLNQYVMADALGLHAIHVNRVLRQLREQNLLTVRGGKVSIHDLSRLRTLAGYHSVNGEKIY